MLKHLLSCLLSSSIFTTPVFANTDIYAEKDGFVAIEIENTVAEPNWVFGTTLSGYSGIGYYLWDGPNYFPPSKAGLGDTITYHFRIENPGNYELRMRSYIAHGEDSTESNDAWFRFSTGTNIAGEETLDGWTKVYMNRLDEWSWLTKTTDHVGNPVRQYFGAGDHTVEISGRSKGFALDRFVLYKYEESSFSNNAFNNLPESKLVTGESATSPHETGGGSEEEPVEEVPQEVTQFDTEAGLCEGDSIALIPGELQSVVSGGAGDSQFIEVAENGAAYLKFDLRALPDLLTGASLQFFPESDHNNFDLMVHSGDHTNWNTDSTSAELPDPAVELANADLDLKAGVLAELSLDHSVLVSARESLILQSEAESDSLVIDTTNADTGLRLHLSGSEGFCDQWAINVSLVEESDQAQEEVPDESETEDQVDGSEQNPDNGSTQDSGDSDGNEEEPEVAQGSAGDQAGDGLEGFAGAIDWILICGLPALLLRRRFPGLHGGAQRSSSNP